MKEEEIKEEDLIRLIIEELRRAEKKHPNWPLDIFAANCIIQEEAGEITKSINQFYWDRNPDIEIGKEIIQTAAMCVRFLKHWGKYSMKYNVPIYYTEQS